MQIQHIPLGYLTLSDLNVRKTERDADIGSLAADIEARGLKQNLVIMERNTQGADAGEPTYEVIAGGRRFQAMKLLVEQGKYTDEMTVPCLIEGESGAVETSLSENLHRVAMNPADEFLAFKTIIDASDEPDDVRIAYCAKRFSVTEAHVRGRLRLSSLSETILDALRTNVLTLGQAMAYASVDNPELQAKVFEQQCKSNWKPHDPDSVRRAMNEKVYSEDFSLVKYIGIDAYIKRGGRTDVDLFTLDSPRVLIDTKLVDDMVVEKFNKQSKKLAEKNGFQAAKLTKTYYDQPKVEGYKSHWCNGEEAQDTSKSRIGLFYINHNGEPTLGQYVLVEALPVDDDAEQEQSERIDYAAQQEERRRLNNILLEQVRLAVPVARAGAFENRIFLPRALSWIRSTESDDGQEFYFEVNLRLTKDELDVHLEEATANYERAVVAAEEEKRREREERDALAAKQEALKDEIIASETPPAVIQTDHYPYIYYRWENGEYFDEREGADVEPDQGADNVAELLEYCQVLKVWQTFEEYEAETTAEDEGDDEDAEQAEAAEG